MKRLLCFLLCALLSLAGLAGCRTDGVGDGKLHVVATLFPQYDFARRIAGERAEVSLLLPPGVESHSFDPTPADMVRVQHSDLFLYTGKEMEPWAGSLIDGLDAGTAVVDLSEGIALSPAGEAPQEDEHDHDHLADPHIWTSPVNAMQMVSAICDSLIAADPEGAGVYQKNAQEYTAELQALDDSFRTIVAQGKRTTIAFSGRFALHYFAQEYGLTCVSALESCSGESEPSAQSVARVISVIRDEGLPTVYYEELSDPKVGRSIAAETGAELMLFHSCHNLSKDEFHRGETYLSIMRQNADHLKAGLN